MCLLECPGEPVTIVSKLVDNLIQDLPPTSSDYIITIYVPINYRYHGHPSRNEDVYNNLQ